MISLDHLQPYEILDFVITSPEEEFYITDKSHIKSDLATEIVREGHTLYETEEGFKVFIGDTKKYIDFI